MATRIQIRRGNSSQWGSSDPVLAAGELSVDNDTLKMKVGDGSSNYSKLKYLRAERPDNLFLGELWINNTFMHNYDETSDVDCEHAFNRAADFGSCGNIKHNNILPEYISVEVFDAEGKQLGKFGPNLSKAEIMQEIKRVGYPGDEVYSHIGAGQGIYIIFYIEYCHGAKPHLVLYNDLYGAILDRDFKSTCSQLFRNLDNVAHTNAQKDFIQDFFMKRFNYNVESKLIDAARTFIKVNRQRAYHVYDPGECIRGKSFFRLYRQYEGGGNKGFVEVTNVDEGARFSLEYRWYYHWLKHKETGVVTTYLDDSNTRLPDELIEDAKEEDYEIRGPVVIYEMKFHNDNDNYDYYRFKVGGAGANRIAYCSNTFPAEIDVDEEYPNVKMYIEYKYPSLYSKVKVDDSINYSTEQYFSDDGDRCWPFAIRLNVADILHAVKPMKKSDRGQIKCRIGFFYPDSGKFSRPSEWFKISLRHHNSPLGATFIK